MTGLFRRRTLLPKDEVRPTSDVLVIGGGASGLSFAYHLAERHGIRDVAVIERAYVGSGGSGRNTQVLRANYNTPETIALYRASLSMYRKLSQELDLNVLFTNQGELDLCHTEDSLQVEREKAALNRAMGVRTDILGPDRIREACRFVDLDGGGSFPVLGASYHPPGSFARHDSVVWGYAQAAARRGVRIHQGIEVTGIRVEGGRCVGVETTRGPLDAGHVVISVAGWSSHVASMADLRLPVVTHLLQAFVTEPYRPVLRGLISSMDLMIYVSQTSRGEVLVGAEIVPYATYSTRSTFEFLAEASRRTIRILPFLANARAMRQWGGSCDMTPDSSPILGPTGIEDLSLIAGMGTWGFKGAPIFGATMAEYVATGRVPALIRPFGLERFRADRMVPDAASAGTH